MILYRLTKIRYLPTAWSGQGAKAVGGRWNAEGTLAVYSSETASLSMLETLVHLHATQLLDAFALLSIDVPNHLVQMIDPDQLPDDWASAEPPRVLVQIGDQWLWQGEAVALRIPSALSPVEYNFLLNPRHPEYSAIIANAKLIDFQFDNRLK